MTMLSSIMLTVTVAVFLIMVPRIYGNWLQFKEYAEAGDIDNLINLQSQQNGWVIRHFSCAILALILTIFLRYSSEVDATEQLTRVTALYSMVSFLFAFVESVLANKISTIAVLTPETVNTRKADQSDAEIS